MDIGILIVHSQCLKVGAWSPEQLAVYTYGVSPVDWNMEHLSEVNRHSLVGWGNKREWSVSINVLGSHLEDCIGSISV